MKKKGVLFIIDVIVGFAILFIGVVLLFSYYYNIPISNQPEFLQSDITEFLLTTTFLDFSTQTTAELLANQTVSEEQLFSSYLAELCLKNQSSTFEKLLNETILPMIPSFMNYEINVISPNAREVLEELSCLNNDFVFFDDVTYICSCIGLQNINNNISGHYVLAQDIDCFSTSNWNDEEGFLPIDGFEGILDGNGKTIYGLYSNRDQDSVGLFGSDFSGIVANIDLSFFNITGKRYVSALSGGPDLDGSRYFNISVINSLMNGTDYVGGIAGRPRSSEILYSSVIGGIVMGENYVGGFVGRTSGSTNIYDSFSTTTVDANGTRVGSFVGSSSAVNSNFERIFATGEVIDEGQGLFGELLGTDSFIGNYWDINATGKSSSAGDHLSEITGLNTEQMIGLEPETTMPEFDFLNTWEMQLDSYPVIRRNNISLNLPDFTPFEETFIVSYEPGFCLTKSSGTITDQSAIVSTSQNIIMGLDNNQNIVGPYILEVKIW